MCLLCVLAEPKSINKSGTLKQRKCLVELVASTVQLFSSEFEVDPAPFYLFANTLQFTYAYRNSVWRIRIVLPDPGPNYCFGSGSETYIVLVPVLSKIGKQKFKDLLTI